MKKFILIATVGALLSLSTSCQKCNTCSGSSENELNHDYCGNIYRTNKTMDAAKETCEARGGTWAEKAE